MNEPSGHLTGCLHIAHRIHLLWDMMTHPHFRFDPKGYRGEPFCVYSNAQSNGLDRHCALVYSGFTHNPHHLILDSVTRRSVSDLRTEQDSATQVRSYGTYRTSSVSLSKILSSVRTSERDRNNLASLLACNLAKPQGGGRCDEMHGKRPRQRGFWLTVYVAQRS